MALPVATVSITRDCSPPQQQLQEDDTQVPNQHSFSFFRGDALRLDFELGRLRELVDEVLARHSFFVLPVEDEALDFPFPIAEDKLAGLQSPADGACKVDRIDNFEYLIVNLKHILFI
jgi:hypothetical protein